MVKTGKDLGVQLGALTACGGSSMPKVAEAFINANGKLAGTDGDASTFARTGTIPGTPGIQGTVYGQVYPSWNQVRNELQRIMGQSATNLYDTGDALVRIAQQYAATDDVAATELKRQDSLYQSSGHSLETPGQHKKPVMP